MLVAAFREILFIACPNSSVFLAIGILDSKLRNGHLVPISLFQGKFDFLVVSSSITWSCQLDS